MPGLLRARRRLRPRQRRAPAPRSTATSGSINGQKVWTSLPTWPTGASCWPAPSRAPERTRACPTCSCRWTSRASSPPDRPAHRHRRVQRGLLRRRAHRRRSTSSARRATAGGSRWARSASSAASRRSASRSGSAASSTASSTLARRNGALDDPLIRDRLARAWIGLRDHARARAAHASADEHRRRPEAVDRQAALGRAGTATSASWPWTSLGAGRPGRAGPDDLDEWQRLFLFTRADTIYGGSDEIQRNIIAERVLGLPARGRDDRVTDCHLRLRPRPRPARTARSSSSPPPPAPASARAAARRCLEEGAAVVDQRQPTSAGWPRPRDALAAEHGDAVASPGCDVTDEAQVQALLDARGRALRRHRRDDQQRRPRRHRRRRST